MTAFEGVCRGMVKVDPGVLTRGRPRTVRLVSRIGDDLKGRKLGWRELGSFWTSGRGMLPTLLVLVRTAVIPIAVVGFVVVEVEKKPQA